MAALRRTRVGAFSLDEACTLEEIGLEADRGRFLRPVDGLFSAYPALTVDGRQEMGIRNGQSLDVGAGEPGLCRVYGQSGEFLALAEIRGTRLVVKKSFFTPRS